MPRLTTSKSGQSSEWPCLRGILSYTIEVDDVITLLDPSQYFVSNASAHGSIGFRPFCTDGNILVGKHNRLDETWPSTSTSRGVLHSCTETDMNPIGAHFSWEE